jgi:hypothetical protein
MRIWCLMSKTCCILEEELGRIEEHGKKFPEQGRKQYRHEDLPRLGEPERVRENSQMRRQ